VIACAAGEVEYLRFDRLGQEAAVSHAVFTRRGGVSAAPFASLNASISTGDEPAAVHENRHRMAAVLGLPLISTRPVHDDTVVVVRPEGTGHAWVDRLRATDADAMITDASGFGLFWAFADCVPILLYDPRHHAIALAHGGWRGTARAIAAKTVRAMSATFATKPADLLAGIAPAIGDCCYRASDAMLERFHANDEAWASACFTERPADAPGNDGPGTYLDLRAANRRQLLAAGLRPECIEMAEICTGCRRDLFYSHRMERGRTGRFGVAIGQAS
jgi:hypothetical protein